MRRSESLAEQEGVAPEPAFDTADERQLQATLRKSAIGHGLKSIVFGTMIVWMGVCWLFALSPVVVVATPFVVIAIEIPLLHSLRRRILLPRVGYVEFKQERETLMQGLLAAVKTIPALFIAVSLPRLWATAEMPDWRTLPLGKFTALLLVSICIALIGDGLGGRYFVVLLSLFLIALQGTKVLTISTGWAFVFVGIIILCSGIFRLRRFLHDNPVLENADGI